MGALLSKKEKSLKYLIKILAVVLTVLGFVLIRLYQEELFYDPFIEFYSLYYHDMQPPEVDFLKLIGSTSARYWLNSLLSIGLIHVLFRKKSTLRFSIIFYGLAFLLLMIGFYAVYEQLSPELYMVFFYMRRFLIQPIFILLLIPAFYYQRIEQKKQD